MNSYFLIKDIAQMEIIVALIIQRNMRHRCITRMLKIHMASSRVLNQMNCGYLDENFSKT